ncbi:glycerate kinase [Microbacterium sp. AG157]|uniref:Glycerate kinase n=1 Tax=Microbacterium testaceum TaxID=2033 RepID=A0A4Y3QP32_MICTE|nr:MULTISPECIES: glycerate kinase [Microbacterium]REC97935.1 glycerate kinase [Microbacterium sp. AG157]GEB45860.1 glycerate kinase [Microbacterium testaceum]
MRVVIAPDKFKGTLTAREAADAMALAVRDRWSGAEIAIVPMADGGDGTLDALGGANVYDEVTGPLGEPVRAAWRLDGRAAVIEAAAASGLLLAGGADANDPWAATTRGVGELIARALEAGSTRVVVGSGGVASTDGGRGAIEALNAHVPFAPGRVTVLTDTTTTFAHAATVFAPQKGAAPELVARLTERLRTDAEEWAARFGADVADVPRSGAAGGLSGALLAAGAEVVDGAAYVAHALGLTEALAVSDLALTGEGAFDATSTAGKGPGHVLALAARLRVPAVVIAGVVTADAVGSRVFSMSEVLGAERALGDAADALRVTTTQALWQLDL